MAARRSKILKVQTVMRDDFKPGSLSMIEADNRAENAELILNQNSSMVDRRTGVQFANLQLVCVQTNERKNRQNVTGSLTLEGVQSSRLSFFARS